MSEHFEVNVTEAMSKLASLGYGHNKSDIWVGASDFYCGLAPTSFYPASDSKHSGNVRKDYLLIGFDTEFQTASSTLPRASLQPGADHLQNRILSYQCAASCNGFEWEGIWCPHFFDRLTFGEFIVFCIGMGLTSGLDKDRSIPRDVYLAAHFTRADIPAFLDFPELLTVLDNVRSTFIVMGHPIPLKLIFNNGESVTMHIHLRDTMTLTPATSKSLKALGELVGIPKVELSSDKRVQLQMLSNMEKVRSDQWDLFYQYAMTDAKICLAYAMRILEKFASLTGKYEIPVTLTSIGVTLVLQEWNSDSNEDEKILGVEYVKDGSFDKSTGRRIVQKRRVYVEPLHRQLDFATSCYHGGRNEQYWFGPSYPATWNDFDLSSAYPTAMALINKPQWDAIRFSNNLDDFLPESLALASVRFRFPSTVRYPTLPVRTLNGLIFPLTGVSNCAAPEIYLARQLGAELEILWGVVIPTDPSQPVFSKFIRRCIDERKRAGKKTLEGYFWKELSNSTYGKTAQGLRERRVYDMRDRKVQKLPPSKITQPVFAAFITSFVRAVLGEVMNAVPRDRLIFSCTTDGFLTDATDEEIRSIQDTMPLCKLYGQSQKSLTGETTVLEKKHQVRRLLGWRTRGQATLELGDPHPSPEEHEYHVVLAKGGIYTRPEFEGDLIQNELIKEYFFERHSDSMVTVTSGVGLRKMVELESDFIFYEQDKFLSMEYDWKRNPDYVGYSKLDRHVYFSTKPWESVQQFLDVKELWAEFSKEERLCIRSTSDFNEFSTYVHCKLGVDRDHARFLRKRDPDLSRLRKLFCAAWKHSRAGLVCDMQTLPASSLSDLLRSIGIPTRKSDIQNAKKDAFIPHACPRTPRVMYLLDRLKDMFPTLDTELFVPPVHIKVDFGSGQSFIYADRFPAA